MKIEADREDTIKYMYQCDLCGKVSAHKRTCGICNRDTCSECTFFDPRCMGNYPDTYCKSCFNIGKKYFNRMEEEREKFEALTEKIEQDWRDKALKMSKLARKKNEKKDVYYER